MAITLEDLPAARHPARIPINEESGQSRLFFALRNVTQLLGECPLSRMLGGVRKGSEKLPCAGLPIYSACKASSTALGFLDAMRSNALAGPSGFLLPCSQF